MASPSHLDVATAFNLVEDLAAALDTWDFPEVEVETAEYLHDQAVIAFLNAADKLLHPDDWLPDGCLVA